MEKRILISGNEALAEAAIQAGCQAYFGYPITPQNEITAYMARRMPEEGRVFLQAESELAAINMVFGAAVSGVRAMTTSSSPGISLMQEGLSYMAGAEVPCVVANIARGGPGLGNIAGSQSDYFQATKGGGHGDYNFIVLAPASVQEMADLTFDAFNLADEYRTPVIILADGYLGQMMEPAAIKRRRIKRFKKDWALTGASGREPNAIKSMYLAEGVLEKHNERLQRKFDRIKRELCLVREYSIPDAEIILVAYGTSSRMCRSVVRNLRKKNLKVGLIRPITLWPFPSESIRRAASYAKFFLVVEMSAGQMIEDVRLAVEGRASIYFYGRMGGGIPEEEEIIKVIRKRFRLSEV
ncbi:MAG TPA: 3-methyl-2-oxobutanoate dehydrogenase subunit VorB [Candidatus Omnitrophica bacterium]|nr:3-methyl-2-oxobutanoate dehydrogenase subunit VorB [Candidatus Omnitrophota bacterium]